MTEHTVTAAWVIEGDGNREAKREREGEMAATNESVADLCAVALTVWVMATATTAETCVEQQAMVE